MPLRRSWMAQAAALITIGCVAACSRQEVGGPPTVPLRARVVFRKGGKVQELADRSVMVQFESLDQPGVCAFATIEPDGSLIVATQVEGLAKPGVVPGKHRARINADDNSLHLVAPRFLRYETSGWTITAPSEQEVVLEVWR